MEKFRRSAAMIRSMSGYWILMATSRPSGSVPAVDLRQGRRRERLWVEARERLLDRAAELAPEHREHQRERARRHAVLEPREDVDVLARRTSARVPRNWQTLMGRPSSHVASR
jgi:ribonuclease HI